MRGDILRAPPVAAGRGRGRVGGVKRGRAGGGAGRPVPDTARRARCAPPPQLPRPAPHVRPPCRTCGPPRRSRRSGRPARWRPPPSRRRRGPAGGGGRRRRGLGCRWRPRPSPGRGRGRWGLAAGSCAGALVRALPGASATCRRRVGWGWGRGVRRVAGEPRALPAASPTPGRGARPWGRKGRRGLSALGKIVPCLDKFIIRGGDGENY